jgi:hypothetical protein
MRIDAIGQKAAVTSGFLGDRALFAMRHIHTRERIFDVDQC